VQAFNNFEKAIYWLSAAGSGAVSEAETEMTFQPKVVPVRKLKPGPTAVRPARQPVIQIRSTGGSGSAAASVKPGKIRPSGYPAAAGKP
jgi:hypothetical protein